MIGTIAIYRGTGSLASGEHPYICLGGTVHPVPVKSFSGKFVEDLDQVVDVPVFDGWSSCNLCRLSSGSWKRWYWITDISRVSDNGSSVRLALTYCPTMDVSERGDYTVGQSLRGDWTRFPSTNTGYTANFEIAPGTEIRKSVLYTFSSIEDRITRLGYTIPTTHGVYCWVQLTFVDGTGDAQQIKQYGFIAECDYPNPGSVIGSTGVGKAYPGFMDLVNRMYESISVVPSSVIDMSVSPYCPYNLTCPDASSIAIADSEGGTALAPDSYKTSAGVTKYYGYTISSGMHAKYLYEEISTVKLDTVALFCGSIRVTDPLGTTVGTLPLGLRSASLQMRAQCVADTSGMCLRVFFSRNMVQIPMPHIPFVGSQWDQYRAYSMALDREALQYSINTSRESLQISKDTALMNTALSVGSSLLSGNVGGAISSTAGTLIGMYAQDRSQELTERTARFQQSLTEHRVQASSPVTYQQSAGFQQILNYKEGWCAMEWWATPGTDTSTFTNYYTRCGAPCAKYNYTLGVEGQGYYQGRLYTDGAPLHGPCFDRLAELYAGGVLKVWYKDVTE